MLQLGHRHAAACCPDHSCCELSSPPVEAPVEYLREPGESWSHLPTNLFECIVNLLSLRDVRSARLVCKEWLLFSNQTLHRLVPCAVRLPHVVATFPSLHNLYLRSTAEKFEVDLTPVTKLNRLLYLNVQGDIPMSAKGLVTVHGLTKLRKLSYLVNLRMSCFQIAEGDTLRSVALLRNLRTLALCGSKEVTDSRLKAVARMTRLNKLNLSGCDRVSADGILLLKDLPSLTALDISFCRSIDDKIAEALAALPGLVYLDVSACWLVTDYGIAPVCNMAGLRILKLSSCYEITDEGLQGVQNLKNLEVLDVSACEELSDCTLKLLRYCQNLRSLDVSHCSKITDSGIEFLRNLQFLTSLNVSSCGDLSDAGIKAVSGLSYLLDLDVGGSRITDSGAMNLCRITRLTCLHLNECHEIADSGVLAVSQYCKHLIELDLRGCRAVSLDAINKIEKGMRVRIVHSGSNESGVTADFQSDPSKSTNCGS